MQVRTPRQFKVRFTKVGVDTLVQTPQLLADLHVPDQASVMGLTVDLSPLQRLVEAGGSGLAAAGSEPDSNPENSPCDQAAGEPVHAATVAAALFIHKAKARVRRTHDRHNFHLPPLITTHCVSSTVQGARKRVGCFARRSYGAPPSVAHARVRQRLQSAAPRCPARARCGAWCSGTAHAPPRAASCRDCAPPRCTAITSQRCLAPAGAKALQRSGHASQSSGTPPAR